MATQPFCRAPESCEGEPQRQLAATRETKCAGAGEGGKHRQNGTQPRHSWYRKRAEPVGVDKEAIADPIEARSEMPQAERPADDSCGSQRPRLQHEPEKSAECDERELHELEWRKSQSEQTPQQNGGQNSTQRECRRRFHGALPMSSLLLFQTRFLRWPAAEQHRRRGAGVTCSPRSPVHRPRSGRGRRVVALRRTEAVCH